MKVLDEQVGRVRGRTRTRAPGPAGIALLAGLALSASACGGSNAAASGTPTASPSTSTSVTQAVTPTSTPTPSATSAPLSPFEDKAPVKAARAWAVAMAKSVNDRDRSLRRVVPLATASGLSLSKSLASSDIDKDLLRPGPQPFTPVKVRIKAGVARLETCYETYGWALDRETRQRAEKRKVELIVLEMRRVGDQWKFDNGYQGTGDCAGVKVPGVRW